MRGSRVTKSPTSMPSLRTSSGQWTSSSISTSMLVSKLRGALTSGFTWTEAFSTWMVPEYLPSNLVMISTLLVSTLLAFRPPMGVIIKEPLSLMWRTMAPSVAAWAVRVMGFPSPPM